MFSKAQSKLPFCEAAHCINPAWSSSLSHISLVFFLVCPSGRLAGHRSWSADGSEDWAGQYIYCNGWDLANSIDPHFYYPVMLHPRVPTSSDPIRSHRAASWCRSWYRIGQDLGRG
eukprot:1462700-Rhodomonas_salina.1